MVLEDKAMSITVLAFGLFLELQVGIEANQLELRGEQKPAEDDLSAHLLGREPHYFVVPFTKEGNTPFTMDYLDSILKYGSDELDRLLYSNGMYDVMKREVAVSQVLLLNDLNSDKTSLMRITPRFDKYPVREELFLCKYDPSEERQQFQNLSRALGKDITDINTALWVLHEIITNEGLEGLKLKLMNHSSSLSHQERRLGRNLYLDCMYLLHGLCRVRISIPPTNYQDYHQQLLGFVLKYAGLSTCASATVPNTYQLTTKGHISHHQNCKELAMKTLIKSTVYGPNVDVDEIAKSIVMPIFRDDYEPKTLLSLHRFATTDSNEADEVIRRYEDCCRKIKNETFSYNCGKFDKESFVKWLYSKCQHHEGERSLSYLYTLRGVQKQVRQFEIFASICQHLDEGLFTRLPPKGKEQAILSQAQNLQIIPRYPLDGIVDKRIWKFFPKQKGASQLSNYQRFMNDVIALSPHTYQYDKENISLKVRNVASVQDHDSLWVDLGLTAMKKRPKPLSDMTCGEFQQHLRDASVDMSFINPILFQFRLLFCSNSHVCRALTQYTTDYMPLVQEDHMPHRALFFLDSKCQYCFQNALMCAVSTYQQYVLAFGSLCTELVELSLMDTASPECGRAKQNKDESSKKNGRMRCVTFLKTVIDEFLPVAVIKFLWEKKSKPLPDDIALRLAKVMPLPAAQFAWNKHNTCGKTVPPTIIILLCYAKEIAGRKNVRCHLEAFEQMVCTLVEEMFISTDYEHAEQCIEAITVFFDHIIQHATVSLQNQALDQIPPSLLKTVRTPGKRKTKSKRSKRRDDGSSSSEDLSNHNLVHAASTPARFHVMNDASKDVCNDNHDIDSPLDIRSSGNRFILSESLHGNDGGHDSDEDDDDKEEEEEEQLDNDDDDDDDDEEQDQVGEAVECDMDNESECSWKSTDDKQKSGNLFIANLQMTKKRGHSGERVHHADTPVPRNICKEDPIDVSSGSDDEAVPYMDLDNFLKIASTHGGDEFASEVGKLLIGMGPFSRSGMLSIQIRGKDVRPIHVDYDRKKVASILKYNAENARDDAATQSHAAKKVKLCKDSKLSSTQERRSLKSTVGSKKVDSAGHSGHGDKKIQQRKSPTAVTPVTMSLLKRGQK